MPVGLLRQVAQPRRHLVRDVVVRQQAQEPRIPCQEQDALSQVDRCHTRAAASAPSPFSDQCSAIGAIKLPLRLRSQGNTNPATPVAATASTTPATVPSKPPPNSRVKPTLLLVRPSDVAMCHSPNST